MSDLRPLSASLSKLTSEATSRKFVALGRILTQWDDIVGKEMAQKAQPLKINYRKPKTKGEKPQASLDVAVSSADATLLHYQKDLILERLNHLYGDKWITAIRFVHIASNTHDRADFLKIPLQHGQEKAIFEEDIEKIHQVVNEIDDEEIRKQLEKLGQSVLRKRRHLSGQ